MSAGSCDEPGAPSRACSPRRRRYPNSSSRPGPMPFRLVVGRQHDREGTGVHARQCTWRGPDRRGTLGPVSGSDLGGTIGTVRSIDGPPTPTPFDRDRFLRRVVVAGSLAVVAIQVRSTSSAGSPTTRRSRSGSIGSATGPGSTACWPPGRPTPRSSWPARSRPSTSTSSTRPTRWSCSRRSRSCPSRSTTSSGSPSRSRSSATCSVTCRGGRGRSSRSSRRRTRSSTRSSTATAPCS